MDSARCSSSERCVTVSTSPLMRDEPQMATMPASTVNSRSVPKPAYSFLPMVQRSSAISISRHQTGRPEEWRRHLQFAQCDELLIGYAASPPYGPRRGRVHSVAWKFDEMFRKRSRAKRRPANV